MIGTLYTYCSDAIFLRLVYTKLHGFIGNNLPQSVITVYQCVAIRFCQYPDIGIRIDSTLLYALNIACYGNCSMTVYTTQVGFYLDASNYFCMLRSYSSGLQCFRAKLFLFVCLYQMFSRHFTPLYERIICFLLYNIQKEKCIPGKDNRHFMRLILPL